ncbi:hypothetical protein K443DRAFT_682107 [Laccaria amethystina LaAM-08-1]|jgi:hypothetical protein|uniref:Uncharacterized protein n=1 Tax=Laccaria amethystina LaAM-08-1 TaxID=1095629 RepID=A0A0C9XKH2_9AGAR|nr:hypothetical protein K443DRAFT_682107 [Laccaria amethystina LaAM-08-1]
MNVEPPVLLPPEGGCKNGFDAPPNTNNPQKIIINKMDASKVYRYKIREKYQ